MFAGGFIGSLVGFRKGINGGMETAELLLQEAQLSQNTAVGFRLWHNTITKEILRQVRSL